MAWLLRFDPLYDDATLWLYKRSKLTGRRTNDSVKCRGLSPRGFGRLRVSKASVDEIVEETVKAAHELNAEIAGEPARAAAMQAKVSAVQARLGIEVEVKR